VVLATLDEFFADDNEEKNRQSDYLLRI